MNILARTLDFVGLAIIINFFVLVLFVYLDVSFAHPFAFAMILNGSLGIILCMIWNRRL